jgi:putative membrane protein insertion efficiency factor
MINFINKFFNQIIISIIKLYQLIISPYLGNNCRFNPTCSNYAIIVFQKYNIFKALYLTIYRILRCNPFFKGGNDYPTDYPFNNSNKNNKEL